MFPRLFPLPRIHVENIININVRWNFYVKPVIWRNKIAAAVEKINGTCPRNHAIPQNMKRYNFDTARHNKHPLNILLNNNTLS